VKTLVNGILRSKFLQPLWEKIHSYSIVAMNFWGGAHFESSGELWVAAHVIKNSAKKNIIVFDVGANQGFYALELLRVLGSNACIYCFEPSEMTFKALKSNIGEIPNIKLFNFGFGDKKGRIGLFSTSESSGLSSVYGDNPLTKFDLQEDISLDTLDDFCKSEHIQDIDFLKIDVEGHEYKVLLGAPELLNGRHIKTIQFEIGECNISSRTFLRDFYELLKSNYRIYRILPHGIREIMEYKTIYEIFVCVNYLAILR
jgi:FkbM family methyltransferase